MHSNFGKLQSDVKNRLRYTVRMYAAVLACGFVYLIFYVKTGYGIPCPIKTVTGLSCPGCGISRMFINIAQGRWREAYMSNQAVFVLLPVGAAYAAVHTYTYVRYGQCRDKKIVNAAGVLIIAVLIIFGILRNAQGYF